MWAPRAPRRAPPPPPLTTMKYSSQLTLQTVSKTKVIRATSLLSPSSSAGCGGLGTRGRWGHGDGGDTARGWRWHPGDVGGAHLKPGTSSVRIMKSLSEAPAAV